MAGCRRKIASCLVGIGRLLCLAFLYGRHFLKKISLDWPLTLTTQPSTSKLSDNPAYLRLISANGAVFAILDLQIYFETSSLQWENILKLPGVLGLLLRKTGHWPLHDIDIKSFDIGAFLSSLLSKEQMMISDKKKHLVLDYTNSKRHRKACGGFEDKIASFKRQHL